MRNVSHDFSKHANRVDETATKAFEKYTKALERQAEAESRKKQFPPRFGAVSPEYAAASARAQADALEATQEVEKVRREMVEGEYAHQMKQQRAELAEAVKAAYSVNPNDIDPKALELLKSGIMGAAEYETMMRKAVEDGNITMARLCGKFAGEAADARENDVLFGSDAEARALRAIEAESKQYDGRHIVDALDALITTFSMCANNPHMIPSWSELTGPILQSFDA